MVDLNIEGQERTLRVQNNHQFGDISELDVYLNSFRYGTASLIGDEYVISFGSDNSKNSLVSYSDSLLNPYTYSNINPYNQISWNVNEEDMFVAVKHVLVGGDIVITVPLTINATKALDITHLYDRGFSLPEFARMQEAYYYNGSSEDNEKIKLTFFDYAVHSNGQVFFLEDSTVHELFITPEKALTGKIYFNYAKSLVNDQLQLANADGFYVNLLMPDLYYGHTTIDRLTVSFNDFAGASFAKVYYDLDLRQYFMEDVKAQYEQDIFGLGKMMSIPLYIDIVDLAMSNPQKPFDISLLESINLKITDSENWPGSFITDFESQELNVLNLPYQRAGLSEISLYNLIADSWETDEFGYVHSNLTLKAPEYHSMEGTLEFKIDRIEVDLSDVNVFSEGQQITGLTDIEFSDRIEVYMLNDQSATQIALEDIVHMPIQLTDITSGDAMCFGTLNFITKYDASAPEGFITNYYYSRFEMPSQLGLHQMEFSSFGTPLHEIIIGGGAYGVDINVIQEGLSDNAIYLDKESYELNYGQSFMLKGYVLDNDEYIIEDEVYQYNYQEALDGKTVQYLDFEAPVDDPNFISREEFSVYYINENLEVLPLYSNFNGVKYFEGDILSEVPEMNFLRGQFMLALNWKQNSPEFINYDTNLLISYKVLKGHLISPLSFSSLDSYGNDKYQHLVEIPFARYDNPTGTWETERDFVKRIPITKVLMSTEFSQQYIVIDGPKYDDDTLTTIQTGIIAIDGVYHKNALTGLYEIMDDIDYTAVIISQGSIDIDIINNYVPGDDYKVVYHAVNPIKLEHSLKAPESVVQSVRIINSEGEVFEFTQGIDYEVAHSGNYIHFIDLHNSILNNVDYCLQDTFEFSYHAPLSRKVDLAHELILFLQDGEGNYVPIDTVLMDGSGSFKYTALLNGASKFSLPVGGGKRKVNLMLAYLPETVWDKKSGSDLFISYTDAEVGSLYSHVSSTEWIQEFSIITIPREVSLQLIEDLGQNMLIDPIYDDSRDYLLNYNPLEALETGEEYTHVKIDARVNDDITFKFLVTDGEGKVLENIPVWLHMGFMPKSESQFINDRAIVEETGGAVYFESLGTDQVTFEGPGEGPNKMFGRPLTYELANPTEAYSAYGPTIWTHIISDSSGFAEFNFAFDEDYIANFIDIFGLLDTVSSIEDMPLYFRAFVSDFEWDEFAIENPEQYICSDVEKVFDGTVPEDINVDFEFLQTADSTYMEGLFLSLIHI